MTDYAMELSGGEITDKQCYRKYSLTKDKTRKLWFKNSTNDCHIAVKMVCDILTKDIKKYPEKDKQLYNMWSGLFATTLSESLEQSRKKSRIKISARRDIMEFNENMLPIDHRLSLRTPWELLSSMPFDTWRDHCIDLWERADKDKELAESSMETLLHAR